MFSMHHSSPAQGAYSAGYLLSLISMEMEFPKDLGTIALEFLKDPEKRLTLSAGLARMQALMGASRPDEYNIRKGEFFLY